MRTRFCLALHCHQGGFTSPSHSLFFHVFPTSSNLSFTSYGPKTPSVNSQKTSAVFSQRTWSKALFIAFARYSTSRADSNRTVNAHQLPNKVHQLHGLRSPTLPSMFTNLSSKFTKFHQRTTEDQKLIVEFHELFPTINVSLRIKNLPLNFAQLFPVVWVCTFMPLLFSLSFVSLAFWISTFLPPFTSFATTINLITVSKMYRLLERICFISFWQRLWKAICLPALPLLNAPVGPVPLPLRLGFMVLSQCSSFGCSDYKEVHISPMFVSHLPCESESSVLSKSLCCSSESSWVVARHSSPLTNIVSQHICTVASSCSISSERCRTFSLSKSRQLSGSKVPSNPSLSCHPKSES